MRQKNFFFLLTALLAVSFLVELSTGTKFILPLNINNPVIGLRLSRALIALSAGAALSGSGVIYQAVFKNPMAEPYLLGASAGASFAVALTYLFSGAPYSLTPLTGFAGATAAVLLSVFLARRNGVIPVYRLLLTGLAVSFFFSALTPVLLVFSGKDLYSIFFFMNGTTQGRNSFEGFVFLGLVIAGCCLLLAFSRYIEYFLLGEERSHQLGVNVELIKRILLLTAAFLTGASVAYAGVIGFVGLIIPHVSRFYVGVRGRHWLLASILMGGAFLLLCDTLARTVILPREMPIGAVTALVGAPYLIRVVSRNAS